MKLTLTADWTAPTPTTARIVIGGYTAVVETVDAQDLLGRPCVDYEFTIIRDHFEMVGYGRRNSMTAAREAVESMITLKAQAAQKKAV